MKTRFLILSIALGMAAIFSVSAQSDLPRLEGNTLVTVCGYPITQGDNVKIGLGTMPDGSFKYIRRHSPAAYMFEAPSSIENQALENQINAFPSNQSGFFYDVRAIEKRGNEKRGYVFYLRINMGPVPYEVDVESALYTGELVIPEEFLPQGGQGAPNLAAELSALKALQEKGILSYGEFLKLKEKAIARY